MLKAGGDISYSENRFGKWLVAGLMALLAAALISGAARAGERQVASMSLEACLKTALQQNPDIEIAQIDLISAEHAITIQESVFDPEYSTGFSYSDSQRPSASVVNGNSRKITSFSMGIGGERKSGDSYSLELSQTKTDTNSTFSALNPSYTMDMSLNYRKPLARGRGRDVTLSQLRISSINWDISELELTQEVMDLVLNVETAYWKLVYAEKALEARKESLSLAKETLDRTQGMIEAGALAESQLLLVQSQLARRREEVITAQGNLSKAMLNLKLAMRIATDSDLWGYDIIGSGAEAEAGGGAYAKDALMSYEEGLRTAMKNRPDFLQNIKEFEAAGVRIETAKDGIKPSVDLEVSLGVGGLKDNYSRSLQDITSFEYPTWQVGLWMDSPVGRREARARLEQRRNDEKKAKLEIDKSIQEIAVDIEDAEISVRTAENRVEAAAVAREYAEKKFFEEEEKHALGIATTHDVLEYQEDLALARMNEYSAIVERNIALAEYYDALGIILEKKNIKIRGGGLFMGR